MRFIGYNMPNSNSSFEKKWDADWNLNFHFTHVQSNKYVSAVKF